MADADLPPAPGVHAGDGGVIYKLAIRPLPARSRPPPGSTAGAGVGSVVTRQPPPPHGLDGGDDELDFQPAPGPKKRKTPACPMANGRHDVMTVYDGDVVDGTDRHSKLAPIMLDSEGGQGEDEEDEEGNEIDYADAERVRGRIRDEEESATVGGRDLKGDGQVETLRRLVRTARTRPTSVLSSTSTRTCDHRKILFLRRKAALITLFLDATQAIKSYWKDADDKLKSSASATAAAAATATASKALLSKLPEVDAFEKLLPALEDIGPCDWPPDRPNWREGQAGDGGREDQAEGQGESDRRTLGLWRTRFAKRRKIMKGRKEVVRGGWAPEGSFEFERSSKAANVSREGAKARASLHRLAHELRHILLTIKPKKPAAGTSNGNAVEGASPTKTKQRTDDAVDPAATASTPAAQATGRETSKATEAGAPAGEEALERTASVSKEGSEVGSGAGSGKKKPKKKKRSVLANQSNPHHVDNYRSTRTVNPTGDPNEPYPHHASLLFPPSMAFLSARPGGAQRVRASEEDFICAFCEYDLFYGTERQRRAAIRSRKQELRRKAIIKNKAKSVADGRGGKEEEYDDDDGDEGGEECEDQGYGKCSCGRALGPHGDKEHHLKPPDPDPNITPPPLTTPAMPRMEFTDQVGGDLSRASTPSID